MKLPYAPVGLVSTIALIALSGCATKPATVAIAPPPAPVAPVVVAMPKGAYAGMQIPARLPDGGYVTPNRNLTPDATIWHLRVALNVAALACRGAEGDRIVADYNALLTRAKVPLATAESHYAAQFKAAGGSDWRAAYDNSMTRLYNFFSQSPARDAFCAAAATTLTEATAVDAGSLGGFAATRLPTLEQPFTDFYRAFDAWRTARAVQAQTQPIYALSATTPPGPPVSSPVSAPVATPAGGATRLSIPVPAATPYPARPRLELDASVLQDSSLAR